MLLAAPKEQLAWVASEQGLVGRIKELPGRVYQQPLTWADSWNHINVEFLMHT